MSVFFLSIRLVRSSTVSHFPALPSWSRFRGERSRTSARGRASATERPRPSIRSSRVGSTGRARQHAPRRVPPPGRAPSRVPRGVRASRLRPRGDARGVGLTYRVGSLGDGAGRRRLRVRRVPGRRVRRRAHVLRAHRVHVRVRGEVPRGGRAGRRHRRAERVFSLPRHVPRARAAHGGGARAPRGPAHARPRRARVVPVHGRLLERVRGTGARAGQRNAVRRRDLQLRHGARRRAGGLRSRLPRRGNHLAQQIRRFGIGRYSKRRGVRPHHRGVAVDHRRRRHALRRREPEGQVLRRARVCHRAGRDHAASAGALRARRARGGVRADHDARRRARRRRGGRTA